MSKLRRFAIFGLLGVVVVGMAAMLSQLAGNVPRGSTGQLVTDDSDLDSLDGAPPANWTGIKSVDEVPEWPASLSGGQNEDRLTSALYYNDFSMPLGPEWSRYDSVGHGGWGLRRPDAITVVNNPDVEVGGALRITARMGTDGDEAGLLVSGGLKLGLPQRYGRYTFRIRAEGDPDEATSAVALLWPESEQWPRDGELNIFETWTHRDTRTPVETFVHYLAPGAAPPYEPTDDRHLAFQWPGVDGTEWNVFSLEWRPEELTLSINDGDPVVLTQATREIPQTPMELTFQLDAFDEPGQQPSISGERSLEVDWVLIEALPDADLVPEQRTSQP